MFEKTRPLFASSTAITIAASFLTQSPKNVLSHGYLQSLTCYNVICDSPHANVGGDWRSHSRPHGTFSTRGSRRRPLKRRFKPFLGASSSGLAKNALQDDTSSTCGIPLTRYLIYWRGEHKEEYSQEFRQLEFLSALSATIKEPRNESNILPVSNTIVDGATFSNAFSFDPHSRQDGIPVPLHQVEMYNEALQYVSFPVEGSNDDSTSLAVTPEIIARATQRCSLIHSAYLVVADAMEYSDLAAEALKSEAFNDMTHDGSHDTQKTWRIRRHEYGFSDSVKNSLENHGKNATRFGKRSTRSVKKEKAALGHLKSLLTKFRGNVDLKSPDCNIYLLEGTRDSDKLTNNNSTLSETPRLFKILARKLASGAKVSIMAPKTRICVTNTPLCPIAAYLLCNIAQIRANQTILDPFAGSAATLLASSLITASSARTVGVEIATDQFLSRESIRKDFTSRGLLEPVDLLEGNVMDSAVRDRARDSIGGDAFDVILTDPPYGIREAMSGSSVGHDGTAALFDLLDAIGRDRKAGTPLLKQGGRFVTFFPCRQGKHIQDLLPSDQRLENAGLQLEDVRRQRLNSGLSRWILSFVST